MKSKLEQQEASKKRDKKRDKNGNHKKKDEEARSFREKPYLLLYHDKRESRSSKAIWMDIPEERDTQKETDANT